MAVSVPFLTPAAGPTRPMASMPRVGLRQGPVHHYQQRIGGCRERIHDGFEVEADTVFELAVFPDLGHDSTDDASPDPCFDGCRLGLDFVTDEGRVRLLDQHRHPVDGSRQCLVADNWNLLRIDLSPLVGRRVQAVELVSDPALVGSGWVQALGIAPASHEEPDVVDRVRTTRGTHSAFLYSRGNALPLTCLPQGFNFLVPLTESRNRNWLYGYHRDGGPRPRLQALAFSHQPSPWIADRSAFQLMAWQGESRMVTPSARARAFDHADECDRPHYYRVTLEGTGADGAAPGSRITMEMTPTSRAGIFRFAWDDVETPHGVILDQPYLGRLRTHELPDGRVAFEAAIAPAEGWSAGRHRPQPPAYVYGETSSPVTVHRAWEMRGALDGLVVQGRRLANSWFGRHLRLPLPRPQATVLEAPGEGLEVRAAMSFISVDQARRNLELEVGEASFDEVAGRAQAAWRELLGRLEIDGGTLDDRVNAWSNLAALYSWPNDHHENTDTAEEPRWQYASPFHPAGLHTPSHTGCRVVDGQLSVNNGYWDTFRTCWPLYSLLTPEKAPELLAGILQQYRDGGWMARWSAPGYVDCMPGTSSDAIFADAANWGTFGSLDDELDAYDSALRNALGPSDDVLVGRKGIGRARFVGWVDTDTAEGLSWTMDNCNCDAGIALWSGRLAERAAQGAPGLAERLDELRANAVWFANRSLAHRQMIDPDNGFYRGRRPDGSFREGPFDPTVWGHDYTETSGWGQAFHAQHDGAALAEALGGEQALADKLDELRATPAITRPSMWGMHSYNTQEMNEAQAAGLGQLAISNQPAHHIPYMYLFAGQPWKTQWLTRELLDKQFVGSEIGQGYPGDEDNGEMSGWWLCTAMGLYPLFVGGGEWAITAPLFERFGFTRANGTRLEVRASGVEHRYIQSVRVNGQPWDEVTIPATTLAGDCLVEFELGPEPSRWGVDSRPLSMSRLGGEQLRWQHDRTLEAEINGPACLVDDEGRESVRLRAGEVVQFDWADHFVPSLLTLTSPETVAAELRVELRLVGADEWTDAKVTPRASQHPDQTSAYLLEVGQAVDGLRLVALAPVRLSQVEVY